MLDGFIEWPAEAAQRYRERGYWEGITLGERLRKQAEETPGRIAIVHEDRHLTFQELDRRADRLAAGLHGYGLSHGDRVIVQLPNIVAFFPVCFALLRIGAIPVLALPAHRENELAHMADLSGATACFIADSHLGYDYRALARTVAARVPALRHVFVVGQAQEFVALDEVDAAPCALDGPRPGDVALLLLSGGTTGLPKLIPRTHDDYGYAAKASAALLGLDADTRYLAVLPVAHNFPLACPGALGTLFAGGTVVLCPDPSPDTAFALIESARITHTALIPPLVLLWLEAAAWNQADLGSLQWLQVGGARLKAETAARVGPELGCRLQQVYGMAEGLLCYTRPSDAEDAVLDTQGAPLSPDDEVRIVDGDDRDVPPDGTGELLVRGPYTIRGYYRAAEYNRRAFTPDGYYRSGDLVRRTAQGNLVVEGRNKDVINRAGEKIPVEEVENLLLAHPAVVDAALVGLPDEVLGERSCACVIARGQAPTLADLNAHLTRLGVAAFKLPDRLRVLPAFPLTSLGKVNRSVLAQDSAAAMQEAS